MDGNPGEDVKEHLSGRVSVHPLATYVAKKHSAILSTDGHEIHAGSGVIETTQADRMSVVFARIVFHGHIPVGAGHRACPMIKRRSGQTFRAGTVARPYFPNPHRTLQLGLPIQ